MIKLFPFQGVPSLAPFGPQLAPSGPLWPPFPAIPSLVSLVVPSYLQTFFTE